MIREDNLSMIVPPGMGPHINKVMRGEYDIPLEIESPRILDIGANVGAFSIWASYRWPGARINAYEPNKQNFECLSVNLAEHSHIVRDYVVHECAVGSVPGMGFLYDGKNNCGECSLYKGEEQLESFTAVNVIRAVSLPAADIIKIDTEGSEVEILTSMGHGADNFKAILFEYHNDEDCDYLLEMLHPNYRIYAVIPTERDRGIVKLIKK